MRYSQKSNSDQSHILKDQPRSIPLKATGEPSFPVSVRTSDGISKDLAIELSENDRSVVLPYINGSRLEGIVGTFCQAFPQRNYHIAVLNASDAARERIANLAISRQSIHLTTLIDNLAAGQTV